MPHAGLTIQDSRLFTPCAVPLRMKYFIVLMARFIYLAVNSKSLRGLIGQLSFCLQTSADGNLTTSILTYTPTIEDSGKLLSCRAENPLIHGSSLQDGWKMNIHCESKS